MAQFIEKSALVAEIEKLIDEIYAGRPFDSLSSEQQTALWYIKSIMSSVNTLEVKEMDLENYISNKLRELGADLVNHKPYSFNRGLNVGKTNAYNDILDRLNTRKEN